MVGDVDRSVLDNTVADLQAEGIHAIGDICDVTDLDSLNALANKAQHEYGGMHLVFANAGISAGESGAMWDYSEKD